MGKIYSDLSNVASSTPLTPAQVRLKDVFNPFLTWTGNCDPKFEPKKPIQSGKFYPSGSEYAVVIKAEQVATGWEFDLMFRVFSQDEHDALVYMLLNSDTLLWQDVLPRQHYVQTTEELPTTRLRTPGPVGGAPVGWAYEVTAHFVEVARPAA